MARVPVYTGGVEARALPGQRQQAQRQDDGLGEGLQSLGQGLQQLAKGRQIYLDKVDEATVADLDSAFANDVRQIERTFTSAQGKNAVDIAADTQKAWAETRASYLSRANNPTQAALLNRVLDQRAARWSSQYDTHLTRQADTWQTEAFKSRIATMSVDVADLPVGSVERTEAVVALGAVLDEEARRKGWDPATRKAEGMVAFSGIHENTIGALVAGGDVETAREYLDANRENILPDARVQIENKVNDAYLDFTVDREIRGGFTVDETPEVSVSSEDGAPQTVRMAQPVNARIGSRYGPRRSPGGVGSSNHRGVDYPVPVNTPVSAALPGIVRVKNDPDGYGTYVVVDHGNGLETRYAHLNRVNVQDGQRVEQGDTIALSGGARGSAGAGNSQGAHLHYEVRRNGAAVDPQTLTGREVTVAGARVSSAPSGMPTTIDDVREWAERRTAALGGDWRMRQRLEQAGMAEVSRTRAARADREGEAARELERYLPGGDNEATGPDGVPRAIWDRASPAERRQARNAWEAELKARQGDEDGVDRIAGNTLFLTLADEAAVDPDTFMARGDLSQYRGMVTEGQYQSLRAQRRALATGGGEAKDALAGLDGVIKSYARQAGIQTGDNPDPEDAERMATLRTTLLQSVEGYRSRTGQWPEQERVIGMLRLLVAPARDGSRRGALFETGGATQNLVVPRSDRSQIIRELRAGPNPILNPTEDQIRLAYRQRLTLRR